jgi:PAS domain S-box-containing protein
MKSRVPETVTSEFVHPSGKRRWYRVEILPCATGIQCIAHDMTEVVETKEELRENEERFRLAVEGTRDGLWDWNLLTDEAYHSDQFERMLGYEPGELPNTSAAWSDLLHPDDQALFFDDVEAYLQGETESYESTFRMRTKDGSWRWITGRGKALFDETGRATRFIGFNTDVTEQRVAEAELSAAVQQREHLLHELTHRVKNYLNLVSSLISLQKASSTDPTSIENIQRQIDAIRFVHDKLNRRDSVDRVDMRTYIQELLDTIFANFTQSSVEIENDIEVAPLPGEIALPLGLITNELATNTMKYGIPEAGGARFSISMSRSDSTGEYFAAVENNGPPIPESVDFENPRSLGLQLVQALSNQVHASMSVTRAPHPRFELRFRLPD